MDLDADFLELRNGARNHVAFHGEQADFRLQGQAVDDVAFVEPLIVPDDLLERKRDLLFRLELDDVGDLLFIDRGQLDEARQAALPGDADRDEVPLDLVPLQKLIERIARELIGVGIGLTEDFRMLDVLERGGDDLPFFHFEANRLEGALPQVDSPNADGTCSHCHTPR